jgi:hypothetical protein
MLEFSKLAVAFAVELGGSKWAARHSRARLSAYSASFGTGDKVNASVAHPRRPTGLEALRDEGRVGLLTTPFRPDLYIWWPFSPALTAD